MSFIIAGDIGGTNARFALLDVQGRRVLQQEVLPSASFTTFEKALGRFIDGARKKGKIKAGDEVVAASFGIAGPVVDQRVKTTNLPWVIDAARIAKEFKIQRVTLLNDLVAVGLGALAASPKKLRSIQGGLPIKSGNIAVIAAGTGLGEAMFFWDQDDKVHIGCATEGGHTDFAPQSLVEIELWKSLHAKYGHVSYERIASGSSISALYRFFVHDRAVPESDANAALVTKAKDVNVAVVSLAMKGTSEAAMLAIELWCSVYGAEAGNLALNALSTSGVFLCGGASGHLAEVLAHGLPARRKAAGRASVSSPFLDAFNDKGRMRPLLEKIPVAICLESLAGLFGAAAHAASQAGRLRADAAGAAKAAPSARKGSKKGAVAKKPSKAPKKAVRRAKVGTATKRR